MSSLIDLDHNASGSQTDQNDNSSYGRTKSSVSNTSSVMSLGIIPFGFEARTSYDASESLALTRSENFHIKPKPVDNDIWKRPPPNFRAQNFASHPPKRNSRDSMQPWKYGTIPGKREIIKRPKVTILPHILNPKTPEGTRFHTQFNIPDSYDGKVEMARELTNKADPYENPKPHDFRDLPPLKPLGLDEFVTEYEKDPYSIHFKSNRLNILWDLATKTPTERDIRGTQMAPPLHQPPKWEARLILEKDRFPNKDYTYTRYRRYVRSPHSALMQRACDALEAKWAREKLEKEIAKKNQENQPLEQIKTY